MQLTHQRQTTDDAAQTANLLSRLFSCYPCATAPLLADSLDEDDADGGADDSLDDAARNEGEYLRGRLRDELGREPTEAELNEWLRQHTEGY